LIVGITTAAEVPPKAAPKNKLCSQSSFSIKFPMNTPISITAPKLKIVIRDAPKSAFLRTLSSSPIPLSNKMAIRVIVVKTVPSLPRSCGEINLSIGPMSKPINISSNTLGIRVLEKRALKV
jgi:hypothetical protein